VHHWVSAVAALGRDEELLDRCGISRRAIEEYALKLVA